MTARRKTPPRVITDRTTTDRYDAPRRHLERGDEVTVEGVVRRTSKNPRGIARCAFSAYTRHESGAEWVDVITSKGARRTVRPEQIATVHKTARLGLIASSAAR